MMSYLCRTGCQRYWSKFDEFEAWLSERFGAKAYPCIFPFSDKLPKNCLSSIHQWLTTMEGRYSGGLTGKVDGTFSLWRPLVKLLRERKAKKEELVVSPIAVVIGGEESTVGCAKKGWSGFSNHDFSARIPETLEHTFLVHLMRELAESTPPSVNLTTPSNVRISEGVISDVMVNDTTFEDSQASHVTSISNQYPDSPPPQQCGCSLVWRGNPPLG